MKTNILSRLLRSFLYSTALKTFLEKDFAKFHRKMLIFREKLCV